MLSLDYRKQLKLNTIKLSKKILQGNTFLSCPPCAGYFMGLNVERNSGKFNKS